MGFFKKQLLKVIKWDDPSSNTITYRYPMTDREEIMNGCQLIVTESQVAILVNEGQLADVFGPGTHRLETKNLPVLTKLLSWKYGFDSPFKADVYYVNTKQFLNQTWGTSNPVMMRDKDFGMVRIRAFGKYSFKVIDAPTLLREVSGTKQNFTTDLLKDHLKTIFVSAFSDAVATANISALDIAAKYSELADGLKIALAKPLGSMGLEPTQVYVENVSLPEEVEKAIDKRTQMGVFDDKMGTYVAMETLGAMRDAASNPSGSGLAGAGVGLGAGFGLAGQMAQNMQGATQMKDKPQAQQSGQKCPKCNADLTPEAKFCSTCGEKVPQTRFCTGCGGKILPNAKFCADCGKKVE